MLERFRAVTGAGRIKPLDPRASFWHLLYLNDDGTELQLEEGLVRGRSAASWTNQTIGMNAAIWEKISQLPSTFSEPIWEHLLLDAQVQVAEIGPAIALAFLSLEAQISAMLNRLATDAGIPPGL